MNGREAMKLSEAIVLAATPKGARSEIVDVRVCPELEMMFVKANISLPSPFVEIHFSIASEGSESPSAE